MIKSVIFARGSELTIQGFRRASELLSETRCIKCGHPNVVQDSLCHQCGDDE